MKVLFFTAGITPTTNENTAINKLKALPIELGIRNGGESNSYGAGVEACDAVAFVSPMTKPSAYSAKPTFNPDKPSGVSGLAGNHAIVTNGQKYNPITVTGTGTYATFTIVDGVITAIALSSS